MSQPTPKCATCQVRNLSLLKNCNGEILKEFSEKKTNHSFQKGEILLTEGADPKGIYCIRSGVAKAGIHNSMGHNLILHLEGRGSIVGQRAFGKKDKQPLTITAIDDMQVCHLSTEKYRQLFLKYPVFRAEMMKALLTEMQRLEKRTLTLIKFSVKEKVAWVLLYIADIYNYETAGCSIHVHLDRQDMADLAGTTKEQVSLVLADLGRENLIHFKAKHFKYFDIQGLKKIAGVI